MTETNNSEKNSLLKEIDKDKEISELLKIKKAWVKTVAVFGLLTILALFYVSFLKQQTAVLKMQIFDQYSILYEIKNNTEYKQKRLTMAQTMFKKIVFKYNPKMDDKTKMEIFDILYRIGELEYNKTVEFWCVLIVTESEFKTWAISHAGAIGLFQVMPLMGRVYASFLNIPWYGPETTLKNPLNCSKIGMRIFCDFMEQFPDQQDYITAYCWGETALRKFKDKGMMNNKDVRKYYDRYMKIKAEIEEEIGYKIVIPSTPSK